MRTRLSVRRMPRLRLAAVLLIATLAMPAAVADRVTITGGADATGQRYTWTVHNHADQRIVAVVFPHYHADLFAVPNPPGESYWQAACTNLMQAGGTDAPGVCRAYVEDPRRGIAPNLSAEFSMRIAHVGAHSRPGQVTVTFADGSQTVVDGVELPTAPTFGERYIMAIGMFAILALIVFGQIRRRRAAGAAPATVDRDS